MNERHGVVVTRKLEGVYSGGVPGGDKGLIMQSLSVGVIR